MPAHKVPEYIQAGECTQRFAGEFIGIVQQVPVFFNLLGIIVQVLIEIAVCFTESFGQFGIAAEGLFDLLFTPADKGFYLFGLAKLCLQAAYLF